MVRKGQFEAAIRDYKRGKNIMQSSFDIKGTAKEAGKVSKFGKDDSNLLPKHYQNVFEKLWVEVVRVVADFREELFNSLRIVTNPIETQERIIL
jgi:Exocyst complex component Sec5